MQKLVIDGNKVRVVEQVEQGQIEVKVGDSLNHSEFGQVIVGFSEDRGWHYLRWGYASYGIDFENVAPLST